MLKLNKKSIIKRSKKANQRAPKKRIFLSMAWLTAVFALILWFLVFYYTPTHPSAKALYYKSLDLSQARQATYVGKPIEKVKDFGVVNNVREQLVVFNVSKDGLSEYALMTLPKDPPKNGHYPTIILCHGYANPEAYSTLETYINDMDFYSQHGFAVIKPDFRGNGFSVASGTPDGAYYSMSYNTDVMSLIASVKQTGYLDKNNISLWGQSMGAYVALRAAVVSPDIKHVVLLSGPVGTPQDMYLDYTPISDFNNPAATEIRLQEINAHGTPASNPAYWNKTTPLSYLKLIKANIQIHVGSKDQIVPPKFSADLNSRLNKLKIPHEYYVYPNGDHGLGAQRGLVWPRSLTFFQAKSSLDTKH
ncbi:MAG TPA: alpha/beta fold hydrolase [Candidatus Saccharimonadales bacterium]|nr:alpha/beta fold hydrolase [Candidatus Saccharimonadales bacterium]